MPASDWTGTDRWKIKPGSVDGSQIDPGDMEDNDLLTITGVGGPGDALSRKPAGTATSSTWGTDCLNLSGPDDHIVTSDHHTGIPFYLKRIPGTPNQIQCWLGRYRRRGGPPTGAAWTAEDQTRT